MSIRAQRHLLHALALAAALPLPALAADWPQRPIRWIVPYVAGTGPDNTARIVAEPLGRLLGQPVVVENRGGAAGNIGAQQAARAEPDGYTWIYSAAPMAANMKIYQQPGFDAMRDFDHVSRISASDIVLVVPAQSGVTNVQDLIARGKAAPGKMNYASGGVGTPAHLGMELFLAEAGIKATHVPYKGASEAVNALLGQQVELAMPIFSVAYSQVEAGRLTALAVASEHRNPMLPDVPTFAEAGLPAVRLTSWGGVSLPAGTPEAIRRRVGDAVHQALTEVTVQRALVAAGGRISPSTPQDYAADFVQEMTLTDSMMRRVGLAPQ